MCSPPPTPARRAPYPPSPAPSLHISGPSLLPPPPPPPNMLPPAPAAAFGFAQPLPPSAAAPAVPSFPSPPPDLALPDDPPAPFAGEDHADRPGRQSERSNQHVEEDRKARGADVGLSAPPVTGPPPTVSGSTAPPPPVSGSIPAPVGGRAWWRGSTGRSSRGEEEERRNGRCGHREWRKKKPDGPPGAGSYASPVMPAVVLRARK